MKSIRCNVLILAGDRGPDNPVAKAGGVARKALAQVGGRPMLSRVIDAVSASRTAGPIFIIANQVEDFAAWARTTAYGERSEITYLEGAGSPVASVERAVEELGVAFPILVVTADSPLLRAADIDAFVEAFEAASEAEIVVALAAETQFRELFPAVTRTFIKLGREGYSGCNMFALRSSAISPALTFWKNIEGQRKKALRLVAAFGLWGLAMVLFGRMDLERAFVRVSEVLGVTVKPYLVDSSLLAMDVDAPEHLALVDEWLSEQKEQATRS